MIDWLTHTLLSNKPIGNMVWYEEKRWIEKKENGEGEGGGYKKNGNNIF